MSQHSKYDAEDVVNGLASTIQNLKSRASFAKRIGDKVLDQKIDDAIKATLDAQQYLKSRLGEK